MTSARRQLAFFARLLALLGNEALELVDRDEPAVGGSIPVTAAARNADHHVSGPAVNATPCGGV